MIQGTTIFDVFRQLLTITVGSYVVVRTLNGLATLLAYWRSEPTPGATQRYEFTFRRYLVVQILRLRPSRFAGELLQIAALTVALLVMLWLHWCR